MKENPEWLRGRGVDSFTVRGAATVGEEGPGKAKYGNRNTNGFDSKRESDRFDLLSLMERTGAISELQCQVPFRCEVNGLLVCVYIADFTYRGPKHQLVVEDAKGFRTAIYKLKKKLVKGCHGIDVQEV